MILTDADAPRGFLSYPKIVGESPEETEVEDTADDDLAALIYTAGTTGRPKGVMHTHLSLYSNARMQYDSVPLPDGLVSIFVLPLCHSYGIASMNQGLFRRTGGAVLLSSFNVEGHLHRDPEVPGRRTGRSSRPCTSSCSFSPTRKNST